MIPARNYGRGETSTKIFTKMQPELCTEKQSTKMSTNNSIAKSVMLCSELHY
jgi:hypothetical protein